MSLAELRQENITDKKVFQDIFLNEKKGIKCVAIKDNTTMNQLFLSNESIKKLRIRNDKDYYICINDLKEWSRTNASVISLNGFYVDVDYKNKNMSKETCLFALWQTLTDNNIFEPTMIFDSGTGLYLLWKIEKIYCNSSKVMMLWEQIQSDLISKLSNLGADSAVKAPSNLIRLPGSFNQKNGRKTSLVAYSGLEYEMSDFREEVSTYKATKKTTGKKVLFKSTYNLNVSRVLDIEKLFELREYDIRGIRNEMLFIYRNCLNLAEDEKAHEKVKEMNDRLVEPLNARELSYLNHDRKQYIFKNETLINHLQINDDEMPHMRTIKNLEEKRRRKGLRNKKAYEQVKQANKSVKEERDMKVRQLIQEGYTQKEVAKMMNISDRTVRNILKK